MNMWLLAMLATQVFIVVAHPRSLQDDGSQCTGRPHVTPRPGVENSDWGPLDLPEPFSGMEWADILAEARDQTVSFHMWSGNNAINSWVDGWLADRLLKFYGVTLV
eukprot:SAG11_NODE_6270_length_1346_cov_1.945469_1_plen_105_part_01